MRRSRWFGYTVLVGLIPIVTRFLIFAVADQPDGSFAIHEGDVIVFGLVLSIANINELSRQTTGSDHWKVVATAVSIVLICMYAVLLALAMFHELQPGVFSIWKIRLAATLLSVVTALFGYSVFDRISFATERRVHDA